MKIIRYTVLFIIIAIGISFAILNSKAVPLNYYFGAKEISLALLLALTLSAGALIGWLLSLPSKLRLRLNNRSMKSRIKQAEQEITNLRAIPIHDRH